ncbi:aminotransferase class V-fold PLP-dependent enzyme [Allobranchiibius sp. GilTou38]|nr:aminotransferase class V-fold PLP-dependent enzyme [Allobranchiibius sp. GilTou38]
MPVTVQATHTQHDTATPSSTESGTAVPREPRAALRVVRDLPPHRLPQVQAHLPLTVAHELGVPTVHRTVVDAANFDHGATTPALVSVRDAVDAALPTYGSVHRGAGLPSRVTTGWFEQARATVGEFVGARPDDEVVFTRNTTDALALLAHCVPRGTQVFAWESAHHAALLPWGRCNCTRLAVPNSASDAAQLLRSALAASDARGKLVVITGACNVTGEVWPVRQLIATAREYGARTVIDAAQLAPHREIDLADLGADWVAFSGHKLYAPYGAGVLVGRRDWLDLASPYLPGGGATARVRHQRVTWHSGAARHEGGTPNAVGAIALAAACATLRRHHEEIERHEAALADQLRTGLRSIPGVRLVSVLGEDRPNVGVVTFTVDGYDPALVSLVLSDEYGISVRDGRFCAHLLCDSILGDGSTAVRASIGLATRAHHVGRLVDGVRRLVEAGPTLDYTYDESTGWTAADDPRDLSVPCPW